MPTNNVSDLIASGDFALSPAAVTIPVNGSTVSPHESGVARINPAGAVTGIIVGAGEFDGQILAIENKAAAANTATMAAAGTSNVAGGVANVLPGGMTLPLVWDAATALWNPAGLLALAGFGITATAAQLNLVLQGVAAGYKLARGLITTASASDDVTTGLATVVAAGASLEDAPSLATLFVQAVVGDQAGAPAAGHVLVKSWKPTGTGDVTPIAATVFTKKVSWWAIGT